MNKTMLIVCLAAAPAALSQQKTFERRVEVIKHGEGVPGDMIVHQEGGPAGGNVIQFVSAELGMPGKLVKGAPYTAEAVTETVQVLGDGNRITRKTSSQLARDSEGRTRRHDKLGGIGPWPAEGTHEVIFISDPVAKVQWVLEAGAKTARKMPLPPGDLKPGEGMQWTMRHRDESGGKQEEQRIAIKVRHASGPEKTESLGKRGIEGVVADGTRTAITIPAGEMGNERPIEIVSERWYSPELQTVVLTRRNDPRFGETTYKLLNIQRAEPPRMLFEVPPDYQVKEMKGDVKIIRETKP
ncbi:MAG: hypothetical protein HY822_22940 [Acidobacteria bacterium]|nr:hypothetical protein [Acidobacteriota bacterium]